MAGQIFSGNINAICTSLMMVAMLVFAVTWEAFTGYLDRRVRSAFVHACRRLFCLTPLLFCARSSRITRRTRRC